MARFGGEEFVVVLPETTVADALAFAEKSRVKIAAHHFQTSASSLRVSSSFGVSGYDSVEREETSAEGLILPTQVQAAPWPAGLPARLVYRPRLGRVRLRDLLSPDPPG